MANQARHYSRLAALMAMVVLTGLAAVAQTSAVRLVTQKIEESRLTTLPGHVHPEANALNDRGPVDSTAPRVPYCASAQAQRSKLTWTRSSINCTIASRRTITSG